MDITFDSPGSTSARTMASMLAETILQDIVTGALPPGSKLKIRELAERYQAGVIPLREAVSRLAMSGFVEAEDQRGFRVTPISRADLEDITAVRQRIESDALRDAIESGNLEWEGAVLAAFHLVNSLPTVIGDPPRMNPEWERAHDNFHATLLAGCRSKWLKHFAATLRTQSARYRHQSLRSQDAATRDIRKEHEDIVKAVLARDAHLACELLRRHFATTTQLVLEDEAQSASSRKAARTSGRSDSQNIGNVVP
ncbi:GntR family transcriptional regulator [Paraburkholderia elongata]|uniref:FCD domain-containing protein n=1 Tax=Paraburkholderia elongata TaxID=2675747 RepID=A0A972NMM2_9BURK|nr:FCD domain-containing protein [Paraburkholderia elongata]NPT55073.1 FCD domain-containing protein [Paraburkholderia elongata]